MTDSPVVNLEAEKQVLGSLMLVTGNRVRAVQADTGIRADHFYFDRNRMIFEAILEVADKADPDVLLVSAELERRAVLEETGGKTELFNLLQVPAAVGNVLFHAQDVIEAAEWRTKQKAAAIIHDGIAARDRGKIGEGEALLGAETVHSRATYNPAALQTVARKLLTDEGTEVFPWPLGPLNDLTDGGMRRGEFVLIGGFTSHGKSVFLDQTLARLAGLGKRCHLFINEMSVEERVARSLARTTGVSYSKIIRNRLTETERKQILDLAPKALPYGLTNCAGWSAEEIGSAIRSNRWDVAAIDILHLIPHEDTRDLERIAAVFARVSQQADCAVIGTVHLNRSRTKGQAQAPRPTSSDIKGASSFEQNANTVAFIHRDQSKSGMPKETGSVYFAKVRNGRLGEVRVKLDGARYRFETGLRDDEPPVPIPPDEALPV